MNPRRRLGGWGAAPLHAQDRQDGLNEHDTEGQNDEEGAQTALLAEARGIPAVSTGELFRAHLADQHEAPPDSGGLRGRS
jgi:hypothetical protein